MAKVQINFRADKEQFEAFKEEYQQYLKEFGTDLIMIQKGANNSELMNIAIQMARHFLEQQRR